MARQLQAQGCSVALLAIMDSYPKLQDTFEFTDTHPLEGMKDYADPIVRITETGQHYWEKKIVVSYDDLCHLQPDQQLAYFLDRLRKAQVAPDDMDISQVRRYIQVNEAHNYVLRRYQPKPYSGRITLFRSEDPEADPSLWVPFTSEPIEVHPVPGDHILMVTEPHVASLAIQLQHCLDEADRT
jgi:thioesterase domain-containing protein